MSLDLIDDYFFQEYGFTMNNRVVGGRPPLPQIPVTANSNQVRNLRLFIVSIILFNV